MLETIGDMIIGLVILLAGIVCIGYGMMMLLGRLDW